MTLRDEIDADFIANSIIIDTFNGFNILVEGETDELFFSKFLNTSLCQIEVCNGKQKVIEILDIINSQLKKKDKTVGIIDKDFDFIIIPNNTYPPNLLSTDFHDVEMMCIYSDSFDHFGKEYFSKEKLNDLLKELRVSSIKEHLLSLTKPISELRIISQQQDLNLAFKQTATKTKELDFKQFICKDKFIFKGHKTLIEAVKKYYNQGVAIETSDLELKINDLDITKFNIYDVCKGHDLTRVIIVGLVKKIGKSNLTSLTSEDLERSLRLSYSILDFQKTELKKSLDKINPDLVKVPT